MTGTPTPDGVCAAPDAVPAPWFRSSASREDIRGRAIDRALGAVVVLAAALYLLPFVNGGWVPHDEGQLGQSAERAMHGEIPHLDFDEAYTGGLTWFYAALFAAFGVELLWLRYVLFAAAIGGTLCFYRLFRRFGGPLPSAVGSLVAVTWAFPNYFAGLPSWWNLLLTAAAVLALFRSIESGRLRDVALAGLLTGLSLTIKQTALYVVAAGLLSLLFLGPGTAPQKARRGSHLGPAFWLRCIAAAGSLCLVLFVLRADLNANTAVLFVLPIAAVCAALVVEAARRPAPPLRGTLIAVGTFAAATLVPFLCLLIPYVVRGGVSEFLHGWLVAPQSRLVHAALAPQHPALLLLGVPVVAYAWLYGRSSGRVRQWLLPATILAALLTPLVYGNLLGYHVIWQTARLLAVSAPVIGGAMLALNPGFSQTRRQQLFVVTCVHAFWSLVQYPFSAPIYFCYTAPLVPLVLWGAADIAGHRWKSVLVPLTLVLLVFAGLSLNRSELIPLGFRHQLAGPMTPLGLDRASLRVPERDAATYRRVSALVTQHRRSDYIYASPDCPEVYFLTGSRNPTRSFYDFLEASATEDVPSLLARHGISVVVINHRPAFSRPPDELLLRALRERYPQSEDVDKFEVRWTNAAP